MSDPLGQVVEVDCGVEAGDWPDVEALLPKLDHAIQTGARLAAIPLPEGAEVSLVLADDALVHSLNREWRDQDKPTNVLSFAANDGMPPASWSPLLGDVIMALETVTREADAQGKTFEQHAIHLAVHGFFHLLGHDHEDDSDAETMEDLERRVLAKLGIADPYASS